MQSWEEKIYERQEGRAEGKAEDVLELLADKGSVLAELRDIILGQKDMEVLKCWLKLAACVRSPEEFCRQAGI